MWYSQNDQIVYIIFLYSNFRQAKSVFGFSLFFLRNIYDIPIYKVGIIRYNKTYLKGRE